VLVVVVTVVEVPVEVDPVLIDSVDPGRIVVEGNGVCEGRIGDAGILVFDELWALTDAASAMAARNLTKSIMGCRRRR